MSSDAATARDALAEHMNGSVARLLVVNAEAELYLKAAHMLSLFLCMVDIWSVLAQLVGSAMGSTAVIVWHHAQGARRDDSPLLPV